MRLGHAVEPRDLTQPIRVDVGERVEPEAIIHGCGDRGRHHAAARVLHAALEQFTTEDLEVLAAGS